MREKHRTMFLVAKENLQIPMEQSMKVILRMICTMDKELSSLAMEDTRKENLRMENL